MTATLAAVALTGVAGGSGPGRGAVVRRLLRLHRELQPGPGFDTLLQAQSGVLCTDSRDATDAASWPQLSLAIRRLLGSMCATCTALP